MAIVASITAIMNFVDSQSSAIGQLASAGDKFLVVSRNCSSLGDSYISDDTVNAFNLSDFRYVSGQKISTVCLETAVGNYSVALRGIGNFSDYLKVQSVSVNGSMAKNSGEGNVGVLLAKTASLNKGDYVNVSVANVAFSVKVVGIIATHTQLDSELLMPLETADYLTGYNLSFVEFSLKSGVNRETAINCLSASLPSGVQIVKAQQTALFLEASTAEIHNFLTVWSFAVYVLVSASSYIVCTRLVVESEYEFSMLKALGAKRHFLSGTVFSYAMLTALAGAVLGISLGLVGTQVAAAGLRWFWQNVSVTPFLELAQVGQMLGLSLLFSVFGCLYPALKFAQRKIQPAGL